MMGGSAMAQNSKQRTICALPFAFLWGNDVDGWTAKWKQKEKWRDNE